MRQHPGARPIPAGGIDISNATDPAIVAAYERNADAIARLVLEVREVLEGLQALRALDTRIDEAVEAVLSVPALNRLRLGWQLFELLAEGQGLSAESILVQALGTADYVLARDAMWGPPQGRLQVV